MSSRGETFALAGAALALVVISGCFVTIADLDEGIAGGAGTDGTGGHGGPTAMGSGGGGNGADTGGSTSSSNPNACHDYKGDESPCPDGTTCMNGCCHVTTVPASCGEGIDVSLGPTICWDGCGGPPPPTDTCSPATSVLFLEAGDNVASPGMPFTLHWLQQYGGHVAASCERGAGCSNANCMGELRSSLGENQAAFITRTSDCQELVLSVAPESSSCL